MSEAVPSHEEMVVRLGEARRAIEGVAHRTMVATSRTLNEMTGARVFLKCENLQRVGAFKIRGAYNTISRLPEEVRSRGVVTYSSGNHAQAVALTARLLGIPALIVMPSTAVPSKLAATRRERSERLGYGASNERIADIGSRLAMARAQGAITSPASQVRRRTTICE